MAKNLISKLKKGIGLGRRFLSPKENRFNCIESNNNLIALTSYMMGTTMAFLRGAIIGGASAYVASGGDRDYTISGALVGAAIDGTYSHLKTIYLLNMRKTDPEKYKRYVEKHHNRGAGF